MAVTTIKMSDCLQISPTTLIFLRNEYFPEFTRSNFKCVFFLLARHFCHFLLRIAAARPYINFISN